MAGWGGGFATGMQAGSQMVSRALEARRDLENQEFLKSERERELAYRAAQEQAGSPAELTSQRGLQVTGPEGNSFYIPAGASDAAATYAREGYTVAEAPTQYQEARVQGGRTLAQSNYDVGPEPLRGLQREYEAGTTKRQMDVARRYGKPSEAAAYGMLDTQALQREQLQGQIAMQPGQLTIQEQQITENRRREGVRDLTMRAAHLLGANDMVGLTKLANETHPSADGSRIEVTKDPKGRGYTMTRLDARGTVLHTEAIEDRDDLVGRMHSMVDPDKAVAWAAENRKHVQAERQFAVQMKKLDAYTAAASKRSDLSDYQLGQIKKFDVEKDKIFADLQDGKITMEGPGGAREKLNTLGMKYGGKLPEPKAGSGQPKLSQLTGTEFAAQYDAAKADIADDPEFKKLTAGKTGKAREDGLAEQDRRVHQRMESRMGGRVDTRGVDESKKSPGTTGDYTVTPPSWSEPTATQTPAPAASSRGGPVPGSPAARAFEARTARQAAEQEARRRRAAADAFEREAEMENYRRRNPQFGLMDRLP